MSNKIQTNSGGMNFISNLTIGQLYLTNTDGSTYLFDNLDPAELEMIRQNQANIEANLATIQTHTSQISAIQTKNTEQDTRLTSGETKNAQQDTRLTTAETDITDLKTENTLQGTYISSLQTSINNVNSSISSLQSSDSSQNTAITNLQNTVNNLGSSQSATNSKTQYINANGTSLNVGNQSVSVIGNSAIIKSENGENYLEIKNNEARINADDSEIVLIGDGVTIRHVDGRKASTNNYINIGNICNGMDGPQLFTNQPATTVNIGGPLSSVSICADKSFSLVEHSTITIGSHDTVTADSVLAIRGDVITDYAYWQSIPRSAPLSWQTLIGSFNTLNALPSIIVNSLFGGALSFPYSDLCHMTSTGNMSSTNTPRLQTIFTFDPDPTHSVTSSTSFNSLVGDHNMWTGAGSINLTSNSGSGVFCNAGNNYIAAKSDECVIYAENPITLRSSNNSIKLMFGDEVVARTTNYTENDQKQFQVKNYFSVSNFGFFGSEVKTVITPTTITTNTINSSGNVSCSALIASGQASCSSLLSSGPISGTTLTASGSATVASLTTTGAVSASTLTTSSSATVGSLTSNGAISGTSATVTNTVSAKGITFPLALTNPSSNTLCIDDNNNLMWNNSIINTSSTGSGGSVQSATTYFLYLPQNIVAPTSNVMTSTYTSTNSQSRYIQKTSWTPNTEYELVEYYADIDTTKNPVLPSGAFQLNLFYNYNSNQDLDIYYKVYVKYVTGNTGLVTQIADGTSTPSRLQKNVSAGNYVSLENTLSTPLYRFDEPTTRTWTVLIRIFFKQVGGTYTSPAELRLGFMDLALSHLKTPLIYIQPTPAVPTLTDVLRNTAISVDGSQNVGIGTTTPSTKLNVNGTLRVDAGDIQMAWGATGINRKLSIENSNTYRNGILFKETRDLSLFSCGASGDGGKITFFTRESNATSANDYGVEAMRISSAGNVSIGTMSNAHEKLVVAGSVVITNDITLPIQTPSETNNRIMYGDKTTPTYRSGIFFQNTARNLNLFSCGDSGNNPFISFSTRAGATLNDSDYGTERMRIQNNGNVGINKTNPAYNLDVNGTINCTQMRINNILVDTADPKEWEWQTLGSVNSGRTNTAGTQLNYNTAYQHVIFGGNDGFGRYFGMDLLNYDYETVFTFSKSNQYGYWVNMQFANSTWNAWQEGESVSNSGRHYAQSVSIWGATQYTYQHTNNANFMQLITQSNIDYQVYQEWHLQDDATWPIITIRSYVTASSYDGNGNISNLVTDFGTKWYMASSRINPSTPETCIIRGVKYGDWGGQSPFNRASFAYKRKSRQMPRWS